MNYHENVFTALTVRQPIILIGRITDEVTSLSPWTIMFADDILICIESSDP